MRIVAVSTLREFWKKHPNSMEPLAAWVAIISRAKWKQPADIKTQYQNASVLKNHRVEFNIKGNDYRLIVAIAYQIGTVYVKFIGTQKQYDAVDAETVEME